jgi:hypothetical protein
VTVIEYVPEYEGYLFVYVDDSYVICDPVTYEVVAVVEAPDDEYAAGGDPDDCSSELSLTKDEEELMLGLTPVPDTVAVRDLRPGWSVPQSIELYSFPEPVTSKVPELEGCRYFAAEDEIAIVDPEEEKVVLLVEED